MNFFRSATWALDVKVCQNDKAGNPLHYNGFSPSDLNQERFE